MKILKLGKTTLFLAVITFLSVISWISFETYRTATKTTIARTTQEQMQPLSPEIDRKIIDNLRNALTFGEEELNIAPEPTPTPKPKSTDKDSQAATESAILE